MTAGSSDATNQTMSSTGHGHGSGQVTPAQGKPALSDTEPPPDAQVAFGDDAAGAVGSPAPPEEQPDLPGVDPADRGRIG